MRRVVPFVLVAALAAAGVWLLFLRGGDAQALPKYTVELDNAFGLTEDAELRVAAVARARGHHERAEARDAEEDDREPSHGPTGNELGSQLKSAVGR